ncbi:hypothetical protein KP509_25G050700 [Ceratopteris richardii]|uniref:Plant lipid transfer protein/Par allergen n=1 Tax=Ceratopteris richardii TaxID=49495 RepID=A0A8T2RS42_CERRI|nr:hypothetical protein KP509_25G050700 [Ceratopteris richardii]
MREIASLLMVQSCSASTKILATPVQRDVCNCLKNLARSIHHLNQGRAKFLLSQCNIPLNTTVSLDTDCSKA